MEIDGVENVIRLNQWLEIIQGVPDALSWPSGYTKEEAYELYEHFKKQPDFAPHWNPDEYPEKTECWLEFQRAMKKAQRPSV